MPKIPKSLHDPDYVAIIAALISRRKNIGMTQWDLAVAMAVDQSWISKIERRERRIDALELLKVCRTLEIDPGEILRPIWEALPPPRR